MSIRVALIEDNRTLLSRLEAEISATRDLRCVAACKNGVSASETLPTARPDVIVIDIGLPDISGIQLVSELRETLPQAEIMMLTVDADYDSIFDAIVAGATGYLVKKHSLPDLLDCIRELHDGGAPMSAPIARRVLEAFRSFGQAANEINGLTPAERDVLELSARGLSYKEVADHLHKPFNTVRKQHHQIYRKLHVRSRQPALKKFFLWQAAERHRR